MNNDTRTHILVPLNFRKTQAMGKPTEEASKTKFAIISRLWIENETHNNNRKPSIKGIFQNQGTVVSVEDGKHWT